MGVLTPILDGLQNLVANLGTGRDKAAHAFYAQTVLDDGQLMAAYRSAWLPRKVVDIPALDACRKWRTWTADRNQIAAIEAEEGRLNIKGKTLEAITAARLFGGAAMLIGTGDTDPSKPLVVDRIGSGGIKYVTVLTRQQCAAGQIDQNPASPNFGKPVDYMLNTAGGAMLKVHPSRLVIFLGAKVPNGITNFQPGWGDSVLNSVMDAITQADGSSANVASLIYEAKVDTIGIPGLMTNITDPRYEAQLLKRFGLAEMGKGINGTLVHDAEEVIGQKTASFATLPDILDRFYQNVSGAADIPMTRLFGRSPGGLSATGDSDIRNYYDRVQAMQELEMSPAMHMLDEAIIRSALGNRPEDVHYQWASLWQTSEKERAEIGKLTAETISTLAGSNLFPVETLGEAAANAMIETEALPGLEAAIERLGMGLSDPEDDTPEVPDNTGPDGGDDATD